MLDKPVQIGIGGSGRKFEPVPADKYTVQISDVNLVTSLSSYSGKEEELLNFEFVILDNNTFDYLNDDKEQQIESTRGRRLWKRMRPVVSDGQKGKASWFYKLLCAVEKEVKSADSFKGVDPNGLIGKQVIVMVNQAPGANGTIWNNILDFAPVKKELEPFEVSNKEELSEEENDKIAEELGF